jgi:hypothetical protein
MPGVIGPPIGYLVVGFKSREDALRVQQDLKTGGYEPDDCVFLSCKEVMEAAEKNLHQGNFLPRLGAADKVTELHLEAGAPFEFAHRRHRLAVEELK